MQFTDELAGMIGDALAWRDEGLEVSLLTIKYLRAYINLLEQLAPDNIHLHDLQVQAAIASLSSAEQTTLLNFLEREPA